ncbi:uncharacterized protein YgiB involved in biofilm formation [Pseudomonas duriflava]|uniref:Uncharacterized protein YgiB involved in biofilm formation n=1 Tax=Pseudomonas duriflava TaxID=459528 RepID=A0A562Q8Q8_9PSED|nr:DUF1190 domain-containing protein [Pseudomonas duriflava]TWI52570.1 uncharacterized protein YgiB involved in biofilm formation [Pseudomonas duriflava]
MRNRSSVKLVLASTLPLALAACGNKADDTATYNVTKTFSTVQECADTQIPVDICSDAYMQAMADHKRIAPTYDDQASCDADFVADYCQVTSDGKYMPKLGGFELAMSGDLPRQTVDQVAAQNSGGHFDNLLMGLLIGNMLSGRGGNHYYSQPIYRTRDNRGNYYNSTLSRQIEQGKTFSRSTQARTSPTNSYTSSTLGRSLGRSSGSTGSSVSSTISRGGFGSQATARSGWSGKSSGGFSSS